MSMVPPLSFLLSPLLMCHADVAGICEHKRIKSQCRDCAGPGICEHKRRRSRCKDCGGSGICEHGQQKNRCKECQGPGICPHGRRRIQCKDCGLSPPTLSLSYLYSCSGCVREVVNFHIHTLSLHMHSSTHHTTACLIPLSQAARQCALTSAEEFGVKTVADLLSANMTNRRAAARNVEVSLLNLLCVYRDSLSFPLCP